MINILFISNAMNTTSAANYTENYGVMLSGEVEYLDGYPRLFLKILSTDGTTNIRRTAFVHRVAYVQHLGRGVYESGYHIISPYNDNYLEHISIYSRLEGVFMRYRLNVDGEIDLIHTARQGSQPFEHPVSLRTHLHQFMFMAEISAFRSYQETIRIDENTIIFFVYRGEWGRQTNTELSHIGDKSMLVDFGIYSPVHFINLNNETGTVEFVILTNAWEPEIATEPIRPSFCMYGIEPVNRQEIDFETIDFDAFDLNNVIEIYVGFRTPSSVALRLMYEAGNPCWCTEPIGTFEEQALTAHTAFRQQLAELPIPPTVAREMQIIGKYSGLFNGMRMIVPFDVFAYDLIDSLPIVSGTWEHILPTIDPIPPLPISDEISVYLNGEKLEFDVPPMIINARTMVPFRVILEALGFEVEWCDGLRNATFTSGDIIRGSIPADSDSFFIFYYDDTSIVRPDVPQQIINNRLMLPLRAIAEATGAEVDWCGDTRTVNITTD